ncbi:cell division protein PerM [Demequina zhanjiangensis]|uniref:DUF6350 family protein n=1 Tax=Demequina zhanjiangensis TaxID=3051659 RepID=A0ABT8FXG8_9MICO|nr:DUF6350 family protein [Demequina sp. SYSU T00b26]MDN4471599.1 DUF6350 family protein [Demequina sp. SYSU T00b26]
MTAPTATAPSARGLAGALPAWASGIVTGAIAAAASLIVVLAPALAALASAPQTGESADWGAGVSVATRLWLLGLGVPFDTSAGAFDLIPLGLTVVILAILVATAQRFLLSAWSASVLAIVTFAALVGVAASLASGGLDGSSLTTRAVLGATLVGVPGIVLGRVRAHGLTIDVIDRLPPEVRTGVRAGVASLALVLLVAAAAGLVSAVRGALPMADTLTALDADAVGAAVLAVAQLLYVPTLVVWMVSWVAGPGFSVGAGSVYSPTEVVTGELPDLPLLGALPHGAGGLLVWAPLLLVCVGAVVRVALRRRVRSWRAEATVTVVLAAVLATSVAMLMVLGSGAAGPGRLASVGPSAGEATAAVVGLVLAGDLAVAAVAGLRRRQRAASAAPRSEQPQPAGFSPPR